VLEVANRLAGRGHQVDLWARTYERPSPNIRWKRIAGPTRPEVLDFESFRILCDRILPFCNYDIIHSAGPNTSAADVYTIQTVHPAKVREFSPLRSVATGGVIRRMSWRLYDHCVIQAERNAYTVKGSRGRKAFLPVSMGTRDELLMEYPYLGTKQFSDGAWPVLECKNNDKIERQSSGILGTHSSSVSNFENIQVIHNGADLDRFNPVNRYLHRSDVLREHGLRDEDFVLLFSGGDWRRKGLDLALRSLALIPEPKIKLLIVGHDRAGADIMRLSDELGIHDRVTFAGFRSDVHRYYATGDLFVFPTSYEAFSLATIEAAASGLPVLMPNVSGAAELLGNGKTGMVIERNCQAIADAVMLYFRSPEKVFAAGAAARKLVEQRFNWDVITDATLDVYLNLLKERRHISAGENS
jgi:glycosyltransferase involved in cell wall biosynthesis